MPKYFINDSGTIREASKVFVNDGGTIRQASKIFANDGGTVRLVYQAVSLAPATGVLFDIITSSTAEYQFRNEAGVTGYDIYVIGGGGSGGTASTDGGREKNSNGGGAGGTAFRNIPLGEITAAAITIGSGGAANGGSSGGGAMRSGFMGGNTTFISDSFSMTGGGGGYGFGSRQLAVPENSTTNDTGTWGAVGAVSGGTASGGTSNWTGGGQVASTIGGDGSRATSGGSVNMTGQTAASLNGTVVSGGGFQQGAAGPTPTLPDSIRFNSDDDISDLDRQEFRGGAGQQHSSGGPVTGATGGEYGAGGGSGSAESNTANAQAGSDGAVIIIYRRDNDVVIPTGFFLEPHAIFAADPSGANSGRTISEAPFATWFAYSETNSILIDGFQTQYITQLGNGYQNADGNFARALGSRDVPAITSGNYAGGRIAVEVASTPGIATINVTVNIYDEAQWDFPNNRILAALQDGAAASILGGTLGFGYADTVAWRAANPDPSAAFDSITIVDGNGGSIEIAATEFGPTATYGTDGALIGALTFKGDKPSVAIYSITAMPRGGFEPSASTATATGLDWNNCLVRFTGLA